MDIDYISHLNAFIQIRSQRNAEIGRAVSDLETKIREDAAQLQSARGITIDETITLREINSALQTKFFYIENPVEGNEEALGEFIDGDGKQFRLFARSLAYQHLVSGSDKLKIKEIVPISYGYKIRCEIPHPESEPGNPETLFVSLEALNDDEEFNPGENFDPKGLVEIQHYRFGKHLGKVYNSPVGSDSLRVPVLGERLRARAAFNSRRAGINKQVQDLAAKINGLQTSIVSSREGMDNLIGENSTNQKEAAYARGALQALQNREMPYFEKTDGYYTLKFAGSRVLRVDDNSSFTAIEAPSKQKPFVAILWNGLKNQSLAKHIFGLSRGDFYTTQGYKLSEQAEVQAKEFFRMVENGIEIFPIDERPGYKIPEEEGEHKEEQKRYWGQTFLESLHPERIEDGQLLGSGASYRAYFFGQRVIVEGNEGGRATYLLSANEFDTLRHLPRGQILESKPQGFEGRVIHPGETDEDRQTWQEGIREYLGRK